MRLEQQGPIPTEPRYDPGMLGKVTALAQRLQDRHNERLSAREMEAIGEEVGLERTFVRDALARLTAQRKAVPPAPKPEPNLRQLQAVSTAWWAAGWTLPLMTVVAAIPGRGDFEIIPFFFFLGLALYIGGGKFLAHLAQAPQSGAANPPAAQGSVSRAELLDVLFTLQRQLEGQKQRRAFLSVDVAGSTGMKQGAADLAVEYSFDQFRRWVEGIVRGYGGQVHSAAGDGMMGVFPDDQGAVLAARAIQDGLPSFNVEKNRLTQPFRVRCGVSAGDVAIDTGTPLGHVHSPVIDRAAVLQKTADPGAVVVGSEVTAAALARLGTVTPVPDAIDGQPVFVWRGG